MRRAIRRATLAVGFLLVALFVFALEAGDALFVQVRETQLRATPGFLATIVERPSYGSPLIYVTEQPGWVQVTVVETESTGWIPEGAVDEDRSTQVQLEGRQERRTITTREVALAGRGFSENLESELTDADQIDFGPVDALEELEFDFDEIVSFVRDGRLHEEFFGGAP